MAYSVSVPRFSLASSHAEIDGESCDPFSKSQHTPPRYVDPSATRPKKPKGVSARQWKKAIKAARRLRKEAHGKA